MRFYAYAIKGKTAKRFFSDLDTKKEYFPFYGLPVCGMAATFGFGIVFITEDDSGCRALLETSTCSKSDMRFINRHYDDFMEIKDTIRD